MTTNADDELLIVLTRVDASTWVAQVDLPSGRRTLLGASPQDALHAAGLAISDSLGRDPFPGIPTVRA